MADDIHPVDLYVGRRLRERRITRGVSQADLGAGLGVSAQQIQKYENGANRVSASKLFEIAERLGTGIDWFFDGFAPRAAMLGEAPANFVPHPASHDATRELIAAFKALPDDDARADVLALVRARAEGI